MAETRHGTSTATARHTAAGEPYCMECATYAADRSRAQRILSGRGTSIQISALALGRILRGWTPERALTADGVGPRTIAVLRGYRAGEQRG